MNSLQELFQWIRSIPLIFVGTLICKLAGEPIYGIEILEDGTVHFINEEK